MNVSDLIREINDLSDENEQPASVLAWINDAIAKINIELGANFPYLTVDDMSVSPAFPEQWQRGLLIPYGVGRIKQKDSSQFEYTDAYNEFLENLNKMKTKYTVPDQYKDASIKGSAPHVFTGSWWL